MIRLILAVTFIVLFLILSTPLMLFEAIIRKKHPEFHDKTSLAIVLWAFRVVLFICGTKVIVKGEENVPKDTAVLYAGNHLSYFDIVISYVRVPRPTGYISKKEIGKVPLLNIWMKHLHCLFLDRDDVKQGLKTILEAIEKAKNGISITIYPDGTRSKDDDVVQPFKEGSFKVAQKAGVPIVPMTIVNSADIFERHIPFIRKTTVILEYGEPIYIDQLDKETQKTIGSYVHNIIETTYFKNKKELPTK